MKSACRTDPAQPSQSLIKQICYPQSFTFRSKPTDWGCKHEASAISRYETQMKVLHADFKVANSGLILNGQWPFFGATPDSKISCTCCGTGYVEVKCPYCHRGESIECAVEDKKFCLQKKPDGNLQLDRSHSYYYQVQTQLFVGNVDYCDFCVCTFSQDGQNNLYIERINKDQEFWDTCVQRAEHFIRTSILPELLAKWYTRSNKIYAIAFDTPGSSKEGSSNCMEKLYCYCNQPESGDMIGCDNVDCPIEWFHFECLKIKNAPIGQWYCPDCRKLPQFTKKKKRIT